MGGFFDDDDDDFMSEIDFYDDHKMDIFVPIIIVFVIVCICVCCGMACKRKREGAIFSTPVVVTSQTHTSNTGPYPVTVQGAPMTTQVPVPGIQQPSVYPMPPHQPMPYPPMGGMGYGGQQPSVPYPTNTPYSMPMPQGPQQQQLPPQAHMNPPSYNEVVGNDAYQKQAPYNPNFSG